MIPVRHIEEMYASAINGARSLDDTRHRGAGEPHRRAFELLRFISELDPLPGDVSAHDGPDEWGAFEPALASKLAAMADGDFLVIEVVGQSTFVQFARQEEEMRADVSSNAVLPPQSHLTHPQVDRLVQLGWRPPTGTLTSSTPEDDPEGRRTSSWTFPHRSTPSDSPSWQSPRSSRCCRCRTRAASISRP